VLITSLVLSSVLTTDAGSGQPAPVPDLLPRPAVQCRFDPAADAAPVNLGLLSDAGETPVATPPAPHRRIEPYGVEGSTRWNIHGAGAVQFDEGDHTIALFGLGLSHFIADGLSLDLELNALFINQSIENTEAANLNLLFRWHFIRERQWTMFLDGGAGLLLSVNDVPANGSSFNFTPQAGLGFTLDLGADVRFIAGARWHHISNANLYDTNPGRDSIMGYAGVSFPF